MTTGTRERDASVETLRGLAVLLMVGGHVIGYDSASGLHVADDSAWRHAYYTLAPLRMPLFTAISGFVYALRPVGPDPWTGFMASKVRRLLLPLLSIGTPFVLLRMVTPGVHSRPDAGDLPGLLLLPQGHFWFLYALAWVFLMVGTLDALRVLETRSRWALALLCAFVLKGSGLLATPVLGIGHSVYLLPYFLLGVGVRRFRMERGHGLALALLAVGAVSMAAYQGAWYGWWSPDGLARYALTSLLGAVTVVGLLVWRAAWSPLAMLGTFSYGIYLMHVFGTAAARILLERAGVTGTVTMTLLGLAAGIALPIGVERFIGHRPWLVLLLLGRRIRAPVRFDAPAVAS
ncbi:MAG TPA: acyltransferase [Anaeromyxobacteraceae bacterium]|nr:acyltransferase [Anaeromyxobacteraceae bacterium]